MFHSDGSAGVGGRTEKASPCAWFTLWYGSWPTMTALMLGRGVCQDLAKYLLSVVVPWRGKKKKRKRTGRQVEGFFLVRYY